jgi:enediyne biosynthesis protein E4
MKTIKPLCLTAAAALAVASLSHAQTDFTKIILTAGNNFSGTAWVDYNGDGHQDLVVANGVASSGGTNLLYQNNGNGTFTRITSGPVATDVGVSLSVACGDYKNDGFPDLFFGQAFGPTPTVASLLYRNHGNGTFDRITSGALVNTLGNFTAVWVDYNNDGFLDIFLANTSGGNFLFRNKGDGTFAAVFPSIPSHIAGGNVANGAAWADYDNDGFPDVFLFGGAGPNLLFHNNGNGTFTQVHGAPFDTDFGPSAGAAWGDYDHDGFLDLFVVNGNFDTVQHHNYLYHNNGNGTFTKVTTGAIVTDGGSSVTAAWEDIDNDGNLDLFVSHNTGPGAAQKNALYLNNGDGTFTPSTNSTLVAESGYYDSVAFGDYDNDGFPDVSVTARQQCLLFHNEGNSNSWITFKLVGTVSNRSAIGAKVRVKATIRGNTYWQMREITNGDGLAGNSLNPHFGLGDATNAETVRIEWPSGTVQEFRDVAAKQFLTVTEPARLVAAHSNGVPKFTLQGGRNLQYDVQWSTNLTAWSLLSTVTITNFNGTALITDTNMPSSDYRFYRALLR